MRKRREGTHFGSPLLPAFYDYCSTIKNPTFFISISPGNLAWKARVKKGLDNKTNSEEASRVRMRMFSAFPLESFYYVPAASPTERPELFFGFDFGMSL